MLEITINPGEMNLKELRHISREPVNVVLPESAFDAINQSAELLEQIVAQGHTVYGVNTGFGLLANTRIEVEDLDELQRSIVLSHAAGIGKVMSDATVKLIMVLKVNSLSRGFSGIRLSVIQALMRLIIAIMLQALPYFKIIAEC